MACKSCASERQRKLCLPWALRTFVMALFTLSPLQPTATAQVKETRRVLILNEVGTSYPGINLIDQGIRTALEDSPYKIEFYREYMETLEFPDLAIQRRLHDTYLLKYRNRRLDVIITVGPSPLSFMVETHQRFFPDVPVIFCLAENRASGSPKLDAHFTGVGDSIEAAKTLEAALHLLPRTEHVVLVGGTSAFDKQAEAIVREQLRSYEDRLDLSYLTNLNMPTLSERLKHLPGNTVVVLISFSRDAAGTRFIDGTESAPMITAAASAPVFSLFDVNLNHGEVGGDVDSLYDQGKIAGSLALRTLKGEKQQDTPVALNTSVYMFDFGALQHWGLKESNLPPGSVVLNRRPTFWKSYGERIVAGMFAFLAQTLIIIALLWQRKRRREVAAQLRITLEAVRESEQRFRVIANAAPVMIWMSGPDKLCTYFNQPWLDFTGRSLEEELGNGWSEGVHAEDSKRCLDTYTEAFDRRVPYELQYRLRRHDGEYRWVLNHGVPRINMDDSFAGYIGSGIDVTERKQAEEALSTVNQKLIQSQEEERTRIARELHDDINQRLALLAIRLEGLQHNPSSKAKVMNDIAETSKQMQDLASDVQALSHHLHSSKLEYLGLAAAAAGFCREVSDRQGGEIDFHSENIPRDLPKEASLCLFRVLQESIQNAIKHSGSRHFEVSLSGGLYEVELTVRDFGIGFDPGEAMKGNGLGLTSIRERLKLVNGNLSIDSQPQRGTTIQARVPLATRMKSAGAVG
jgi:PAS domain S-box-containing protein